MIRSSHLVTLVVAALVSARVDADDRSRFADGLLRMGSSVVDIVAPGTVADAKIIPVDGQLWERPADRGRVERALGELIVEHERGDPVPNIEVQTVAEFQPATEVERPAALPRFPETTAAPGAGIVSLESMLAGDDLDSHDRVHEELLARPTAPESDEDTPARVIAADFLTDSSDAAVTVQLSDDEIPPPPPPAVPAATPETPPDVPAATLETPPAPVADAPPAFTPPDVSEIPAGFIDPRYQSSVNESSVYTSTCRRCGKVHCYCVYAPFGDAVRSAFGQQIHLGSARLMTLYAYDFHPVDTPYQSELTSRGEYQLSKIVSRLQYTPSLIRIQATGNRVLDDARRIRVLESLAGMGMADAEDLVVTVRTGTGRPAIELLESSTDLLESIRLRGRTLEEPGSARFGR